MCPQYGLVIHKIEEVAMKTAIHHSTESQSPPGKPVILDFY